MSGISKGAFVFLRFGKRWYFDLGSKLPTERKIAEQLGIGRNSAREAICVLHGMGVVERKQGSGNYVVENIGQSFGSMIQMLLLLNGVTKSEICEFRRAMEKWLAIFFWKMVSMKKSNKTFGFITYNG